MVDETVAPVSPLSRIRGKRSPSCLMSSCAFEQEGKPEILALVPVIGEPTCSMTAQATREFGQRNATRPLFAVTLSGRLCDAATTMVNAPGQSFFASLSK